MRERQQREHEDTQQLLAAADKALAELEATRAQLKRATDVYRERLEGKRDRDAG